jgi:hypothetical protein
MVLSNKTTDRILESYTKRVYNYTKSDKHKKLKFKLQNTKRGRIL